MQLQEMLRRKMTTEQIERELERQHLVRWLKTCGQDLRQMARLCDAVARHAGGRKSA